MMGFGEFRFNGHLVDKRRPRLALKFGSVVRLQFGRRTTFGYHPSQRCRTLSSTLHQVSDIQTSPFEAEEVPTLVTANRRNRRKECVNISSIVDSTDLQFWKSGLKVVSHDLPSLRLDRRDQLCCCFQCLGHHVIRNESKTLLPRNNGMR